MSVMPVHRPLRQYLQVSRLLRQVHSAEYAAITLDVALQSELPQARRAAREWIGRLFRHRHASLPIPPARNDNDYMPHQSETL